MSGGTVATMIRSSSSGFTPARSSAVRAAGRARSVMACSGAAIRRSLMPVRSMIHSSDVSTSSASSSFVSTRSGTYVPRPVIDTGAPLERPIIGASSSAVAALAARETHARVRTQTGAPLQLPAKWMTVLGEALFLDGEGKGSAGGERAVDTRLGLATADRAAHPLELARQLELVPRLDDALETDSVDPCEERQLAAIPFLGEDGYGACLSHRLDDEDAWHDRAAREVAGQIPLVRAYPLAGDDALARLPIDDLVQQEEWGTMGQDRFDLSFRQGRQSGESSGHRCSDTRDRRAAVAWSIRPSVRLLRADRFHAARTARGRSGGRGRRRGGADRRTWPPRTVLARAAAHLRARLDQPPAADRFRQAAGAFTRRRSRRGGGDRRRDGPRPGGAVPQRRAHRRSQGRRDPRRSPGRSGRARHRDQREHRAGRASQAGRDLAS